MQSEEGKWKYVINLSGKELPLTTMKKMVEKLVFMNMTSSVHAHPVPETNFQSLQGKTLPYGLTSYKSLTFVALSQSFVYFLLLNSTAQELYRFFLETDFPEEHFYATLFKMPGVPGGYDPHIRDKDYFEVAHYFWRKTEKQISKPCFGETVHSICIVNFADLSRVMMETRNGSTALFQNKYFMENDHIVMDCMEERIVDMNKKEFVLDCSHYHANSVYMVHGKAN